MTTQAVLDELVSRIEADHVAWINGDRHADPMVDFHSRDEVLSLQP